jgi:hypothetical protein
MSRQEHYRADGVRIQHDPHAPGMAEKYGRPGETDAEGFDPYAGRVCALTANACRPCLLDCALTAARNTTDSVGPGIYGGKVKRDESGNVIIGRQFQNHNPEPGPVYSGNGYTEMSNALSKASTQTPTPKPRS